MAPEGVVPVSNDGLGPTVYTRSVTQLGPDLTVVGTSFSLASEFGLAFFVSPISRGDHWSFELTFLAAMTCSWTLPES